jgi:hypothetical protein
MHDFWPVMTDLEERVRARAYRLWQEEGCPHGRELAHWEKAKELSNAPAEFGDSPTADDFRAIYSLAECPVPPEDIVGQPPRIVRTSHTEHKVWSSTDFAMSLIQGFIAVLGMGAALALGWRFLTH